jgi:hypothetical protein
MRASSEGPRRCGRRTACHGRDQDGMTIARTVERATLWSVQTAQAFRVSVVTQGKGFGLNLIRSTSSNSCARCISTGNTPGRVRPVFQGSNISGAASVVSSDSQNDGCRGRWKSAGQSRRAREREVWAIPVARKFRFLRNLESTILKLSRRSLREFCWGTCSEFAERGRCGPWR